MESKSTKISEYSLKEIRGIGKDIGEPSDDTTIRHIIAEYKRLKLENELLKKEIDKLKGL